MKYWGTYPLVSQPYHEERLSKDARPAVSTPAARVGFVAIGVTDHPAPTHRG